MPQNRAGRILAADAGEVIPLSHWSKDRTEPTELSDADLLERCRQGDREAWQVLYQRYERLVFSVALRSGLGREDAADVTQTTFVALLDSVDRLERDDRLSFWLVSVARRQSWRVRNRRGREVVGPVGEVDVAGTEPNQIDVWERAAALHDALRQLDSPCRELLLALYFDPNEPGYASIAERFGRAIGTIGPMRGRCLDRLRTILGQDWQG